MDTFCLLSSGLTRSTIWSEPDHVRIVFITMLSMKDKNGMVTCSIDALALLARKSLDETKEALRVLESPDTRMDMDKPQDNEGRRIERTSEGWHIINHQKFIDKFSAEKRKRDKAADNQRRRDKKREQVHMKTVGSLRERVAVKAQQDGETPTTIQSADADKPDNEDDEYRH